MEIEFTNLIGLLWYKSMANQRISTVSDAEPLPSAMPQANFTVEDICIYPPHSHNTSAPSNDVTLLLQWIGFTGLDGPLFLQ